MEKKTNLDKLQYVFHRLGPDEVLAQLAEEAAELAQAALKYRRALTGKNPTPVSCGDALANLHEEYNDTTLTYMMLLLPVMEDGGRSVEWMPDGMQQKLDRWVARLEGTEDEA